MKITQICQYLGISPLSTNQDIEAAHKKSLRKIQLGPDASTETVKITTAYREAINAIKDKQNLLHMITTTEDLHELLQYLPIEQSIELINELQETRPISISVAPRNSLLLSASLLSGHMLGSAAIQYISMSILLTSAIKHAANYFSNNEETRLSQLINKKEDLKKVLSNLSEEKTRYILMLIRHMHNFQIIAGEEIMSTEPSNPNTALLIANMLLKQSLTKEVILAELIKYLPHNAQTSIHNINATIHQKDVKIKNLISDSYIINNAEQELIELFGDNKEQAINIVTLFLSILEENSAREKKYAKTNDLIENFRKINASYQGVRYLYSNIYAQITKEENHEQKLKAFHNILLTKLPLDLYAQLYNALAEDVAFDLHGNMSPNCLNYYTLSEGVTIEEEDDAARISLTPIIPRTDVGLYDFSETDEILEYHDALSEIPEEDADDELETENQWIKILHHTYENAHDCIKDNLYTILPQITKCLGDIIKSLTINKLPCQSEDKIQHKIRSVIKIKLAFEQLDTQKFQGKPSDATINTFMALCRIAIEACNFETGALADYTKMVTKKIDEKCNAEFTGSRSKHKFIDLLEKNDLIFPKELDNDQLSDKINFCLMNNLSPINTCILFNLQEGMLFKSYQQPASWDEYARDGLSKLTSIAVRVLDPARQGIAASFGLFAEMMNKHLTDQPKKQAASSSDQALVVRDPSCGPV